ncbi:NAD(P)H-dependent oxidoreductase [Parendozoicomonas haliclonae]|uniref:General stress protein 14 n=1 Tax=Parendozoicomonas haliclonae TaxID=1960125 RepID=A0A1X7ARF1_9GAMM|nr:NAD(P)H-dependent oxidoreductase [Parendozoicomonas haliclonae]SMA50722.1 General stress protein 14 [Parendozoicomonas haliclonae]
MNRVLIISGHPNLEQSYTNKVILEQLEQRIETLGVRRLDTLYPDYQFDIKAEQQALLDADSVVLQFPFYWYSMPGLLKLWLDEVFTFNFAYGPEGDKLKGKHFLLSFTIGGPQQSYHPLGYNHFSVQQLMTPLEQTAYLAGMVYHPPVYSHGMVYIPGVYNTQEGVEARARDHAEQLITTLEELSLTTSRQSAVKDFVEHWFKEFDKLPDDPGWFLSHIDDSLHLDGPEGTFRGKAGFTDWYQLLRQSFQEGALHLLERMDVSHLEKNHYQVDFLVRVEAVTHNDEPVSILAKEVWRLALDDENFVTLFDYRVEVV